MAYEKNDMVTVTIEDVGMEGEGIGKIDGFPLFIKDAVVGDTVEAKIIKSKKNYAYARVEKVVTPSPFRVEPPCKCHRQCGGCQIQALSYDRQLAFKQDKVRNNLLRIGGFSEAEVDRVMEPVVGMENPLRYRNKAQYPFGTDKQGNPITGFYAGRTHSIIPNTECYLGREENREILQTILDYMKEYHVNAYDEETGKGLIRHALIRTGFYTGEIMVCLVINYQGKKEAASSASEGKNTKTGRGKLATGEAHYLPEQDKLLEKLALINGMTSVSVSINTERTNVIMGKEIHTIWGSDTIRDKIRVRDTGKEDMPYTGEELTFSISPLSFYQVNPMQTEKLYSLALEYAGLTGRESVWDLYCGIGTISLFMALRAKEVYGVEIIPQAIDDARQNAVRNHIANADFFVGKAEEVLPAVYEKEESHPDVIVVDPPRKGCDEKCLDTMLKMAPSRIVYVSCDSATLARDLKLLCAGGYRLERVRPVDQFAHTVHVETVVLLSQRKPDDVIEVEIELGEMDLTSAESKATYAEIKDYVLKEHGLKVSNLYISQVKRKCGIEVGENYNLPKSEDSRQPQCPEEKEKAIKDALDHFGMI
ncbi:MAG: 23S rRNA (uracil(1939)-C(5))-methyltransferase RlmD [Lachnospiraceae bacterium]|nr:23S rRNA (uracil(1939)-C(5))-methyltransferase RlmD [Lachnospiraceae bacterium]